MRLISLQKNDTNMIMPPPPTSTMRVIYRMEFVEKINKTRTSLSASAKLSPNDAALSRLEDVWGDDEDGAYAKHYERIAKEKGFDL
jgi:hypothetical protein